MKKSIILFIFIIAFMLVGCKNTNSSTNNNPNTNNNSTTPNVEDTTQITTKKDEYQFMNRTIIDTHQTYNLGDVKYPDELWNVPEYELEPSLDFTDDPNFPKGVHGLFYASPITYNGKQTKIAAYIGYPENASENNKVPAIVLVHGGLGTAIPDWVKYWNDLGFAAIAMDTEGAEPIKGVSNYNNVHMERNRYENDETYTCGPTNVGFSDVDKPLSEQWMYHATSAVILATSILYNSDKVDKQRVGMTGISWGSMIASIVVGYDDRISFCMPIYGALSLDSSCSGFRTIYGSQTQIDRWDHLNGLKQTNCKMFYVTSTTDFAFSMDAASRSSKAANGFVLYKKGFDHGQDKGALEGNLPFFAKYYCGMESEFLEIMNNPTRENPTLKIRTYGDVEINSIKIVYTDAQKPDKSAQWDSKNVKVIEGLTEYYLNIPESTYCYVQIKYNNNLEVCSYIL